MMLKSPLPLLLGLSLAACGATATNGGGSRVEYDRPPVAGGLVAARPGGAFIGPTGTLYDGRAWAGAVTERCLEVEPVMRVAAMEHQVDIGLIAGIIHVESKFRADAVSRSGARGLMQVMPSVGRRLRCGDLFEPQSNIACGLTVLKRFMARYDEELVYGLSAYNAGYRIPNKAREAGELPDNISYIDKVLESRSSYLRHGCGG